MRIHPTADDGSALAVVAHQQHDLATPTKPEPMFAYRPDIDGLRAYAVVAVLIFHMDESWIYGGYTGVDIFFVISGYVVYASLVHRKSESTCQYFVGFYSRRLKRLSPCLVVFAVVTGLLLALYVPPRAPDYDSYWLSGELALVGTANNYYAAMDAKDGGYFVTLPWTGMMLNAFTHTWSLGVEEQFYFVFPLLAWLIHGNGVSKTADTQPSGWKSAGYLGVFSVLSIAISGVFSLSDIKSEDLGGSDAKSIAFYTLPCRFWELAAGAILVDLQFFCPDSWKACMQSTLFSVTLEVLAIILLVVSIFFKVTWIFPEGKGFPFPWAVVPVLGSMCFIAVGSAKETYLNRFFALSPIVYVGKLSYPMYLWHWPVYVLLTWSDCDFKATGTRIMAVIGIMLVSMASYHSLERIFREWRPGETWHVYAMVGTGVVITEIFLVSMGAANGGLYIDKSPKWDFGDVYNNNLNPQCSCRVTEFTHLIPKSASNFSTSQCFVKPVWPFKSPGLTDTCFDRNPPVDVHLNAVRCLIPPNHSDNRLPNIFLFGDSHAGMVLPGLELAVKGIFTVTSWTSQCLFGSDSYPQLANTVGSGAWPRDKCKQYNAKALELLNATLLPSDVVAVGQAHTKFLETGSMTLSLLSEWGQWLAQFHDIVAAKNASIVLIGDIGNSIKKTGVECFLNNPSHCNKPKSEVQQSLQPMHEMFESLAANHTNIHFWKDQLDLICPGSTCSVLVPGTATLGIYDANHLTTTASLYMWPYLCAFFRDAGLLKTTIPYTKFPPSPKYMVNPASATVWGYDNSFTILGFCTIGLLTMALAVELGGPCLQAYKAEAKSDEDPEELLKLIACPGPCPRAQGAVS